MGGVSEILINMDGRGLEMEALLHEYLTAGPDDWRDRDDKGTPVAVDGRPVWSFDDVDADEFGQVGEATIEFHASFRDVDRRFRADGRIDGQ